MKMRCGKIHVLGLVILLAAPCAVMARDWRESVPPEKSPRLLFSPDEVSALRTKAAPPIGRRVAETLAKRADRWLATPDAAFVCNSDSAARSLTTQVTELAGHGWISGDRRYVDKAISILCKIAKELEVLDHYKLNTDLAVGNAAQLFAMGYDLTRPLLTAEQDALLRAEIRELGEDIFTASTTGKAGKTDAVRFFGEERDARYMSNWNTVTHGNLGLCALVLGDQPKWLARAEERIAKYLEKANDATGAPFEGHSYLGYGKQNALLFTYALKRATGRDLLATHGAAHSAKIGTWLAWQIQPGGAKLLPLNQSSDGPSFSDYLLHLNAVNRDRLGQWVWLRLVGDPTEHGGSGTWGAEEHPAHSSNMAYSLVWLDPDLKPQTPQQAGLPLATTFERGDVVARSGWKASDSLLAVTCARGVGGIWNHADQGGFVFLTEDAQWAVDPGAGFTTSRFHNVLMVDDTEQDAAGGPHPTQGTVEHLDDRGDVVYADVDPSPAYRKNAGLKSYRRQFIYGRQPRPFLVVVDRPEKPGAAKYQWNLITGKDNTILLSKTTPEALITTSTGKRCRVHFAWPGETSIQTYEPEKLENPAIQASTTAESPTLVSVLVPLPDGINATIKVSDDGPGGQIVRIAWSDGVKAEVKPTDQALEKKIEPQMDAD